MSVTKRKNEELRDEIYTKLKNKHYFKRCGHKNHDSYVACASVEDCVKYIIEKTKLNAKDVESIVTSLVADHQFCEQCNLLEHIKS